MHDLSDSYCLSYSDLCKVGFVPGLGLEKGLRGKMHCGSGFALFCMVVLLALMFATYIFFALKG